MPSLVARGSARSVAIATSQPPRERPSKSTAGRVGHHRAVTVILGIQDTQGVDRQPAQAVLGQGAAMPVEISDQGGAVSQPAFLVALGVQVQGGIIQNPQGVEDLRAHRDHLDIAKRARHAD